MKQLHVRELLMNILGFGAVVAILNVFFQSDTSVQETIGRSLFMGLVMGSLFYFYNNKKRSKQ